MFKGYIKDKNEFEKPELIDQFINLCKEKDYDVIITCTARDYKYQTALFAQGRETLAQVNKLRRLAGVYLITNAENQRKVTWTMNSKHIVNLEDDKLNNNKARAFDFCLIKNGKEDWNNIEGFKACGLLGETLGLYSGQRFKSPDYPHLEIPS